MINGSGTKQHTHRSARPILSVVFAFYLTSQYAFGHWTTPVIQDMNGGTNLVAPGYYPQMATDSAGNAWMIWVERDGTNNRITGRYYDNQTGWDVAATYISTSNGQDALDPQLVYDGVGNYFAVWKQSDGSHDRIYYAKRDGATWSAPTTCDANNGNPASEPALASNRNGNVFLAFKGNDSTNNRIYARRWASGWQAAEIVDAGAGNSASNPAIASYAVAAQHFLVVFEQFDGSNTRVYGNYYNGSTYSGVTILDTIPAPAGSPHVAMYSNTKGMAVFKDDGRIYAREFTGTDWSSQPTIPIDPATNTAGYTPRVAYNSVGDACAAFRITDGPQKLFANINSGSWGASQEIGVVGEGMPLSFGITTNGSAFHVAFEQNISGVDRVHITKYTGSWHTPELIDRGNYAAGYPAVCFPGNQDLIAGFIQEDNGAFDRIYSTTSYKDKVWDNGNANNQWGDPKNWKPDEVPLVTDTVLFDGSLSADACVLGSNETVAQTKTINSPGTLDFSTFTLTITGDADFSQLSSITGTGGLELSAPSGTQVLKANAGSPLPMLAHTGAGTVEVQMIDFGCGNFTINGGGTFDNSTNARTITVNSSLTINNSVLNSAGGKLDIDGNVTIDGTGVLQAPTDTMTVEGAFTDNAGGLVHNSGTVEFDGTTGGTITPGSNVNNLFISGTGSWSVSTNTLSCDGDLEVTSGSLDLSTNNLVVIGNVGVSAATLTLTSSPDVDIDGNVDFTGTLSAPSANMSVAGAWTNSSGIFSHNNGNVDFDGSAGPYTIDQMSSAFYDLTFSGTGSWNVSGDLDVDNDVILSSGTFTAPSGYLYVGRSWANSGGTLAHNSGTIKFDGVSKTANVDPTGMYNIYFNGDMSTYTLTAAMSANTVTVEYGELNLGAGLTHVCATLSSAMSMGTLNFSSSTLQVGGNVDFSSLNSLVRGTGTLELTGGGAQSLAPASIDTMPSMVLSGGGTVSLSANCEIEGVTVSNGTLDLGVNSITVTTAANLDISGGTLNAGSGTLTATGDVSIGSTGSLTAPSGASFYVGGGFSVASGGTFSANTGTITFNATSAGNTITTSGQSFASLSLDGIGGGWLFSDNVTATSLHLGAGTLDLGTSLTHSVVELTGAANGAIDFGSSTLDITSMDADFSSLASVTPGTGILSFSSASSQIFTPLGGATFPSVTHAGSGTLQLSTNALSAQSLSQSAGMLDLNYLNVTTTSSDFTITNGTNSTISGLDGITITVAGNASFNGQSGNLLNLNPAATWYLNVTGTLTADYASIMNSDASGGTQGAGSVTCTDGGGNSNWQIGDIQAPDNDLLLTATAIDTNKVQVVWTPSAIDSLDADSVGIWYKTGDYPDSAYDAAAHGSIVRRLVDSVDTITGLNNLTVYYFSLCVRDSNGNWSDTATTAADTAFTRKFPVRWTGATNSDWFDGSNWSTGFAPTMSDSVVFDNGAISCTLTSGASTGEIVFTSGYTGTFDFNGYTLEIQGMMADFRSGGTFTDSGTVWFYAMDPRSVTLIPKGGVQLPLIQFEKGSLTVALEPLHTKMLDCMMLERLIFENLDTTHILNSLSMPSGSYVDFGNNRFRITGKAGFEMMDSCDFETGSGIYFSETAGIDTLAAPPNDTLPPIYHDGDGTLRLFSYDLKCKSFTNSNGILDLNYFNITTFGDLSITNASSTSLANFDNTHITVGANCSLTGQSGDSLNLTSATTCTLSVTGTLSADYAVIGNSVAFVSAGTATNSRDAGGNVNWTFENDTTPPDNDMTLIAAAIDSDKVEISWDPSAIDSTDADSVGIWYKTGDYPDSANDVSAGGYTIHELSDTIDTITGLAAKTVYYFSLMVRDSLGNWSDTTYSANDTATTPDKTAPDNVTAFSVMSLGDDSIALSWTASAGADAESVMVRYRTDATWPGSETDGTLLEQFAVEVTTDTVAGLTEKTGYRFAAFVSDSSGNWSAPSADAQDSVTITDYTPPANVTALQAAAISDTSIELSWTPSASADADSVMIRYANAGSYPTDTGSGSLWKSHDNASVIDTVTGLSEKTTYHFTLFVRDSAGNWSDSTGDANASAFTLQSGIATWTGTGGSGSWSNSANWMPAAVPTSTDSVLFNTSSVSCTLMENVSVRAVTITGGYTGEFNFNGYNLDISGDIDLRSRGVFATSGTDTLVLSGTSTQNLIPPAADTLPAVHQVGTGTVYVKTHNLRCRELIGTAGTFDLSTNALSLVTYGSLKLNGGHVYAANSDLFVNGDVILAAGMLTAPQASNMFTVSLDWLVSNGAFITSSGKVIFNSGTTGRVIHAGSQHFNDVAFDNAAGSWTFDSATILDGSLSFLTSGSVTFPADSMHIGGSLVCSSGTIAANNGKVIFDGATSSTIAMGSQALNEVAIAGSAGNWSIVGGAQMNSLHLVSGSLDLGADTVSVDDFTSSGGELNVNSAVLNIKRDADFSGIASLVAGSAQFRLVGDSIQLLTPVNGSTLPQFEINSAGSVRLAGYNLACEGFTLNAGSFDFNGFDISTSSSGAFTVANGTDSTFANLGGRTVSVTGNASLSGQAGNLLNLNPSSTWNINVSGTLSASYAAIGNANAGSTTGNADSTCVDSSGNVNWSIASAVQPNSPPGSFVLLSPANGSGSVSSSTYFDWATSIDSDPQDSVLTYSLHIGTSSTFVSPVFSDTTSTSSYQLDSKDKLDEKRTYYWRVFALDSEPDTTLCDSVFSFATADETPPATVTNFSALAVDSRYVRVSWTPSVSTDVQKVMIRYRIDGAYPFDQNDGTLLMSHPHWVTSDTATIQEPDQVYYFRVFVQDSSGHWSADTSAQDTALMVDPTTPAILSLSANALGTNSIQLNWTVADPDSIIEDSIGIWYSTSGNPDSARDPASQRAGYYGLTDSIDTLEGLTQNTIYYFSLFAKDTAGSWANTSLADTASEQTAFSTVADTAAAPAFSPNGGTYSSSQMVALSCATAEAQIYYHIGDFSTDTTWKSYAAPFTITSTTTLHAFAVAPQMQSSPISQTSIIIEDTTSTTPGTRITKVLPEGDSLIIPDSATSSPVSISVKKLPKDSVPAGGTVTLLDKAFDFGPDGQVFDEPLIFKVKYDTAYLNAAGISLSALHGYWYNTVTGSWEAVDSDVDSVNQMLIMKISHFSTFAPGAGVAMPVFSPPSGTYTTTQSVEISCATTGASVYYTLDGSEPDSGDNLYSGTITIDSVATLKARAYKSGLAPSYVESQTYTVYHAPVAMFGATPTAGNYPLVVSFTDSSTGDITAWHWDFGNGSTSTAQHPVDTFSTEANFDITLIVSGPAGADTLQKRAAVSTVDNTPPTNNLAVQFINTGDSILTATWTVDTTQTDVKNIVVRASHSARPSASATGIVAAYRDSSLSINALTSPGWWYLSTQLIDRSGNASTLKYDSVLVNNQPPVLTSTPDIAVAEDAALNQAFSASDNNGDSLWFGKASGPADLTVNARGALTWTPDNDDVGTHNIVIACTDIRGGTATDTFAVAVTNVNDAPTVDYSGPAGINEDAPLSATLTIADVDAGDSTWIASQMLPVWLNRAGMTISGTPTNDHVGSDTMFILVRDKAGATDTVVEVLTVNNVNDAPVPVSITLPDSAREDSTYSGLITVSDVDRDDSLSSVWKSRPAWLSNAELSKSAPDGRWQLSLTGTPRQQHVGWNAFSLDIADRAGAAVPIRDSIYIVDMNDPPNTVLRGVEISYGALQISVGGTDDFDSSLTLFTKLSATGGAVIDSGAGSSGLVTYYPLKDGTYQFYAQAVDQAGLADPTPLIDTFEISGATRHTFYDTSGWHMMSAPVASLSADTVKAGGHLSHWDESANPRNVYGYYTPSTEIATLLAGKSYWRKSTNASAIELNSSQLLDRNTSITLHHGQYGWNQVANPYVYPIKLQTHHTLWKWNPATKDFIQADSILEPWQGYWVLADSQETLQIEATPFFANTKLAKTRKTFYAQRNDWRVQLVLSCSESKDADNIIGFSPQAKNGFDFLDKPEPPRMDDITYLFLPHPEWKRTITAYASDLRKWWRNENVFQVGVANNARRKNNVSLRVLGVEDLPDVYLFLANKDTIFKIEPDTDHPLRGTQDLQYHTIFATNNSSFINSFPLRFKMHEPFPNPFRPVVNLKYTLPYRWEDNGIINLKPYKVSVMIYDVKGRVVRTLVNRKQKPGTYQIPWMGKSNSGRLVATGFYFMKFSAGEHNVVKRLIMMK
ncbi:MAG: hypothetical protein GF398_09665 [Chitinivibrionales bacterium]|nr:hypothetical protein [Chitinivibrionales bacterium]